MPTFDDLKYEIRDSGVREKLFAIEAVEVEADAFMLLEYLKNEYAQKEILDSLEEYVDKSVAFEDADESVAHLHQIVLDVEEIATAIDKTARGVKTMLTRRGLVAADYDGASKKEKATA